MIDLRDVRFAYPKGGFALKVDRLSVDAGQCVCWTGPSGCGKTTLLHLVAGIYPSDSGCVETCGVEVSTLGDAARREFRLTNVGLVFQDFALLEYLSVLDNILLPYRINRALRLDAEVRKRANVMATRVGLGTMLGRRPNELSQGERQRAAVCRAIITCPKLLLADEPTANLDSRNAMRVLDALESYVAEQRATLVVVSHDRDMISRFTKTVEISKFCGREHLETVES